MANRPKGFGMTADLARKKAAKFDVGLANEAFEWVGDVLRHGGISGDVVSRIIEVWSKLNSWLSCSAVS